MSTRAFAVRSSRLVPLLSLALFAIATIVQTGCSSGGAGDVYDDAIDVHDKPEPIGR